MDEALTFSELRKVQKQESRQEELSDLEDDFLVRVSEYLNTKKEMEGEDREYRNAKRVLKKIVSLREDKIVKNARLSVTSGLDSSSLDLLPEEQEFFRNVREQFQSHRDRVNDAIDNGMAEIETGEVEDEEEIEAVEENEDTEDADESGEGYERLKIKSHVPEFMGTDLESYGPFEEGDEVEVPEENAEILVNRGNAERMEG